jgi:hypothetical protein
MRSLYFISVLLLCLVSGCITTKFNSSNLYTEGDKVAKVHVIVFGNAETNTCMDYYRSYIVNGLRSHNIEANGFYQCCVNIDFNINDHANAILKEYRAYDNVLVAVVTKTVVGYGTTSSRTIQLKLVNLPQNKVTWSGTIATDFQFFISNQNYKKVAEKLSETTLAELTAKGII